MKANYQALLIVSFGGPDRPEDVMPFLDRVLAGRRVPPDRKRQVAEHYDAVGGKSPLNEQNLQLKAAVEALFRVEGPPIPVYLGNRNWHPFLHESLAQMKEQGISRALAFVTSPYGSYSSCRQYLENIVDARRCVGKGAPEIDKLRLFFHHPGFVEPNAGHLKTALKGIPSERRNSATIVFSAHSIPLAMARRCNYQEQLAETCALVAGISGVRSWHLVFQSRSGSPRAPWLEPDIEDFLEQLDPSKTQDVVVLPIGFISDHMEVIYDLDVEARERCRRRGLNLVRVPTVGIHPAFVAMVRELVLERFDPSRERRFLGRIVPPPDDCLPDCCVLPNDQVGPEAHEASG